MRHLRRKALGVVLISAVCVFVTDRVCPGQEQGAVLGEQSGAPLKYRWFFSFGYERNRQDIEKIKSLVDIASTHGLNGMVLSSFDLDGASQWDQNDAALLREVSAHCARRQIELIPTGFSVGYGGAALAHNRSFAAALPTSLLLQARQGELVAVPGGNLLANGDLEEHANHRFKGYEFHDQPGAVSFADSIASSGRSSIRFENFAANKHGHGRINQKVAVAPVKMYRLTFKIKTEDLQPVSGLKAMVYSKEKDKSLAHTGVNVNSTQDWTEISLDYMNRDESAVVIYAGIWGGQSGRFWIDDIEFRRFGDLSDIPRRNGTPLVLKSKDRDKVFVEGRDFEEIRCLREPKSVRIPQGSSINEGESLELSCYKIPSVVHPWGKQISLCMSNPGLYQHWEKQAEELYKTIKFKKFLLSMDEIRNGGGCELCRQSGKSMAEILGECITKQYNILKRLDPEMEVLIWSDMLDPNHNAHDNYYGVVGDFSGSWKYVPKSLTILCWQHGIRNQSLKFFSQQGFRTCGAAYYDAEDLTNPKEWLQSLKNTPNAQGIMFTTWEKKYQLLAGFGTLVSETAVE